jgi:hypothetical protein
LLCMDGAHPDAIGLAAALIRRQRWIVARPARCRGRDMCRFANTDTSIA